MKGRRTDKTPEAEIDIHVLVPRVTFNPSTVARAPAAKASEGILLQEHFIDMDDALELNKILNQHK